MAVALGCPGPWVPVVALALRCPAGSFHFLARKHVAFGFHVVSAPSDPERYVSISLTFKGSVKSTGLSFEGGPQPAVV